MEKLRHLITNILWPQRVYFIKYLIVGGTAFLFDILLTATFAELLNMRPLYVVSIVQTIVVVYIFLVNKYWSFGVKNWQTAQLIRFILLLCWNYFFSVLAMYIFNELFLVHYLIVRIASVALMVSWNFFLYRFWVYR